VVEPYLRVGVQARVGVDTVVGGPVAGGGLLLGGDPDRWHGVGVSLGYHYTYARVIDNLIGDTHGSGGGRLSIGLSFSR
jgi:hypothetical protein